jgi:protocatechuate 3,4-dioxygenase beta subunit
VDRLEEVLVSRRLFLSGGLAAAVAGLLAACQSDDAAPPPEGAGMATAPSTLAPTPGCPDDRPTPAQTAGPYFTPNSPEKAVLRADVDGGTPLVVQGSVLTTSCRPVARALLDFWQADDAGGYDNEGYRLRGHQFTDAEGRYRLETVVPGQYSGRTRHIHVKVQPPGGRVLTTQLYFPGDPANARDRIYRPELAMQVRDTPGGKEATFGFVVEA